MNVLTAEAVVLDIEGTTGSAAHVRQVLFPYARQRIAGWFAAHRDTPLHGELVRATGAADEADAVRTLTRWADDDVKAAPLKAVQARIWAEGYADGSLAGHVYGDVPGALAAWAEAGIGRYIYSSGAAAAQRDWFATTAYGDLTRHLDGYFDLENTGPKDDPDSYRRIGRTLGAPAGRTLFLSDAPAELAAAAAAGWQTVRVQRPEDPAPEGLAEHGPHPTVQTLTEIQVVRA
ncbi:acireductone synthase [Streptomyces sp. NPDC045431]|uniref:acireductone synthase n=1 Tax=Streptomyces sp. NPDC045431 TaxID=3155613 RepID=UPI0033E289AC